MSYKEIDRLTLIRQCQAKTITQKQASEVLGLSEQHFRHLIRLYEQEGPRALVSKKRGKLSNNRLNDDLRKNAIALIKQDFYDYGPTLAAEKLEEYHQIKISKETARRWMIDIGVWRAHQKKPPKIHPSRERRSHMGEMVQIDGSDHDWFEDRGPRCTLLVFIDDATSEIKKLFFCDDETTINYFTAFKDYLLKHGVPRAFYFDKHGVFKVNHPEAKSGNGLTQFGRVLKTLRVKPIFAHSPQAKGRVERSNSTLQDRLVKALRYHDISTIEAANVYLEKFQKEHNHKFAKPPKYDTDMHRVLTEDEVLELDKIFSIQTKRVISKDMLLRHNKTIYKINEPKHIHRLRGAAVTVCENTKHEVKIYCDKELLNFEIFRKSLHLDQSLNRANVNTFLNRVLQSENQPSI